MRWENGNEDLTKMCDLHMQIENTAVIRSGVVVDLQFRSRWSAILIGFHGFL
jgi:hypothetical protein